MSNDLLTVESNVLHEKNVNFKAGLCGLSVDYIRSEGKEPNLIVIQM